MLYTLTPGESSTFKDIRLCNDLCPGTQEGDMPLHRTEIEQEGTEESKEVIVETYKDPFVVLTYSISSSVTCIASLALLFSDLFLILVQ